MKLILLDYLYITFRKAVGSLLRYGTLRIISLTSNTTFFSDCFVALTLLINKSHLQHGKYIKKFEKSFADYLGVSYAYSFFGGRIGLSAILYALNITEGDEIILPGYTCVVVPNAIIYRGARPVYVDIDPSTFNLDPSKIEEKITERTKAIIIQYTYGLVPNIKPILDIAQKYNLRVIEDCAHALGAEYKGKKLGTFGDAAFFRTSSQKLYQQEWVDWL